MGRLGACAAAEGRRRAAAAPRTSDPTRALLPLPAALGRALRGPRCERPPRVPGGCPLRRLPARRAASWDWSGGRRGGGRPGVLGAARELAVPPRVASSRAGLALSLRDAKNAFYRGNLQPRRSRGECDELGEPLTRL